MERNTPDWSSIKSLNQIDFFFDLVSGFFQQIIVEGILAEKGDAETEGIRFKKQMQRLKTSKRV